MFNGKDLLTIVFLDPIYCDKLFFYHDFRFSATRLAIPVLYLQYSSS